MNRIPIFDVEESKSLSKNLSLMVGLDSEALLGIEASTQTLLQPGQDAFNH